MAVMPVTITSPDLDERGVGAIIASQGLTVSWTLPAGRRSDLAYVGVYRRGDLNPNIPLASLTPPFDYYPTVATGDPNVPYGVVPNPRGVPLTQNSITFDGSYPSTGRVNTGSYIIWLLVVHQFRNDAGEITGTDYGVTTFRLAVSGQNVVPARPRIPLDTAVPPPPPTLSVAGGASTTVTLTPPQGLTADRVKIAVYRRSDIGGDGEPTARPVAFTDNGEPGSDTGAEWVQANSFSVTGRAVAVTFDAESTNTAYNGEGVSGPVPNGNWTIRARYSSVATGRAVSYDPLTGEFIRRDSTYHASRPASIEVTVSGSTEDTSQRIPVSQLSATAPYISWPKDRFFSNVSQALDLEWLYHNRRGVGQKSVQIRRNLRGGTNSGTRYLQESSGTFTWVTTPQNINIRSTSLSLESGSSVSTAWGSIAWGKHTFSVRPTSVADIQGIWSPELEVVPYRVLTLTSMNVSVVNNYLRVTWAHDGSTGNNTQGSFKIAVYRSTDPEGTPPVVRTSPDRAFDRRRPGPARWVGGSDTSFTFQRTETRATNPVPNGTYIVALKVLDIHGNESTNVLNRTITINNTAPNAPSVVPRVYNFEDEVQPGTSGLIAGAYVGVSVSLGGGTVDVEEVRLERREAQRPDNIPPVDDPLRIADLPLGGATGLNRWNDFTVGDRILYQYRATAVAFVGSEASSAWTPA